MEILYILNRIQTTFASALSQTLNGSPLLYPPSVQNVLKIKWMHFKSEYIKSLNTWGTREMWTILSMKLSLLGCGETLTGLLCINCFRPVQSNDLLVNFSFGAYERNQNFALN